MWKQVVLLLFLTANWHRADGYSRGAPDMACSSMLPRHGPNPQNTQPPYVVKPLQNEVQPGDTVTVRLETTDPSVTFRGFLIRATGQSGAALGTFVNVPSNAAPLTCAPGYQNALTHSDSRGKATLDVTWQAPADYQGDVQFQCTFVKNYATFWSQVPAVAAVRVGRSAPPTVQNLPPGYQAPTTYNRGQPTLAYAPAVVTTPSTTTTTLRISNTSPLQQNPGPWSFPTQAPPSASGFHQPPVYEGCGDVKGCFGLHDSSCVQNGNCPAMVTYAVKGSRYEFELWYANAPQNSYVAVGISSDKNMGDDSVTECTLVNGRVDAFMSYNKANSNVRLTDPKRGLQLLEAKFSEGNLYCRFTRESPVTVEGKIFDLHEPHFLLLARGKAFDQGIQYHDTEKSASSRAVNLAETGAVSGRGEMLVKLHGAFMVGAWMFAASLGMLFARYFRLTWVGTQFMGKDLWFVFHRILMTTTWALTISAFVIIFVELGGWTSVSQSSNPHAVLGLITTLLAFIQPIMAYFRPHPGTPKRFIFNWAHWLVGNLAHMLAIVCIFLAVSLTKAAIPYWVNWLLATYVSIHAFTHLILSVAQCCYHADGSRKSTVFAMRDLAPHQSNQNHFYSTQQDKKEDAHGSRFRRVVLAFYIVLVASFSAAVIAIIVTGPWSKQ